MGISIQSNTSGLQSILEKINASPLDTISKSIIDKTIVNIKMDDVTYIGQYAFHTCASLVTADFQSVTTIDKDAFHSCSSLTTINFPVLTYLNDRSFYDCNNLNTMILPNVKTINSYVFQYCYALTTVDFPLTGKIGSQTFRDCTALKKADFSALTSMGYSPFSGCSNLTALIMRNTTQVCTAVSSTIFSDNPIASGAGYIYVPSALIEDYKVATNWSTYAAQFRALEDYTVDGTVTGELDETKI